jgi:phosphatidylglycerophosphatase A
MRRLAVVLASGFGAGYFPVASGTLASALALPLAWWLAGSPVRYAIGLTLVLGVGWWAADGAEAELQEKDPHKVVIDEIAGMVIAVAALPRTIPIYVGAFLLFRLFDVWKPFPARQSQQFHGGVGIMLDDIIAAVYANILMQVLKGIL